MFGRLFVRSITRMSRPASRSPRIRRTSGTLFEDLRSSRLGDGYFNNELWESHYTEIIENQVDKAGNSGQETLLEETEYFPSPALEYCKENGKDYDPEKFVDFVKNDLGDTYYYAINEIIDECSQELLEAWDDAFAGDGMGDFLYNERRAYGNFANALNVYSARASARYGPKWNTQAASFGRNRITATRFLAANPKGLSRTTRSTPYAGRSATESRKISAKAARDFLEKNPNGTPRVFYP